MNNISIQKLINTVIKFRDDREWQALIRLKDAAIALSLESAEVLEHFQWKTDEEVKTYVKKHKTEIGEELMDVLFNALLLIELLGIDVDKAFFEKMKKNNKKYPVEKVKGKNSHL